MGKRVPPVTKALRVIDAQYLKNKSRWIQGDYEEYTHGKARKYCLIGAIDAYDRRHSYNGMDLGGSMVTILAAVSRFRRPSRASVIHYNDAKKRTFAEIKDLLARAIAYAEKGGL